MCEKSKNVSAFLPLFLLKSLVRKVKIKMIAVPRKKVMEFFLMRSSFLRKSSIGIGNLVPVCRHRQSTACFTTTAYSPRQTMATQRCGNIADISELVKKRDAARTMGNFNESDNIRDLLMDKFNVRVDDNRREFWVMGKETDGSFQERSHGKKAREWKNKNWTVSFDDLEHDEELSHKLVELLEKRDRHRVKREYQVADDLLLEVSCAGKNLDLSVFTDDEAKIVRLSLANTAASGDEIADRWSWRIDKDGKFPATHTILPEHLQKSVLEMLDKRQEMRKQRNFKAADGIFTTLCKEVANSTRGKGQLRVGDKTKNISERRSEAWIWLSEDEWRKIRQKNKQRRESRGEQMNP